MNPYEDASLGQFFITLFERMISFISGHSLELASDELQILVLLFTSCSCAFLGSFLVLKKMTMFANSLSHTMLLGIVGAYLITSSFFGSGLLDVSTLLLGAFIAAILTALCTDGLARIFHLSEDASIGLVFSSFFALGIILVTIFTKNLHLSAEAVTGNIDILQKSDLFLSMGIWGLTSMILIFLYRPLKVFCFDPFFSKGLGISNHLLRAFLFFLTACVCIVSFRFVGVLLVLSFLTGPYLIARLFFHRLSQLLICSFGIAIFASVLAPALSRHFFVMYDLPLSTGGIVVSLLGCFYVLGIGYKRWQRLEAF
jgi:manganese/zinc/iron transport system permease protein